jgi:putative ABC transport system permease protein
MMRDTASVGSFRWLDDVVQDLRFALRGLRRQPGFLVAALLTLGLGVGANVVMFSVADMAVFRSLPFPRADRLVAARTTFGPNHERNIWTSSWPDYEDYRDGASSFASLVAMAPMALDMTLEGNGEPERLRTTWISPGFFFTLGEQMTAGREFTTRENLAEGPPVVVISDGLWHSRFGGDRSVVGSRIVLDGEARTVVGVAPRGFSFIVRADVWAPVAQAGWGMARQSHNWLLLGRLASGVTLAQAQAEVDGIARALQAEYPESNHDKGLLLTRLQDVVVEGFGPSLFILWGAVGLVLLIACANVAALLLARGWTRRAELAARAALGAGRARLVRQLMAEHALVGLLASALGTAFALDLLPMLVTGTPLALLNIQPAVHASVLGFAIALALVTVLLSGLPPALAATGVDVAQELKAATQSGGGGHGRLQNALVVGQVAVSVVLLVAAGLLIGNVSRLGRVNPGFATQRVLTADIGLPRDRYTDGERRARFFEALLSRVRALPGVQAAGMVSRIPIRDFGDNVGVWDPGHPPVRASDVRLAFQRVVLPGYFEALGIPLLSGRDVQATDGPESPPVLVVNQKLADALFPGVDPLGRNVAVDLAGDTMTLEVVGTVGDVRISSLASETDMAMYFSYYQRPFRTMGLVIRTAGKPSALVRPVRQALRSLDAGIPLGQVATMDAVLLGSLRFARTVTGVLAIFAAVALLLAGLGLYGLLAFQVTQRHHEIGIRMALGADAAAVFRLVLRRGLGLAGIGVMLGSAVLAVAGGVGSRPYIPVRATDPSVAFRLEAVPLAFVGVAVFLLCVAVAACLHPARRALRVDAINALKAE